MTHRRARQGFTLIELLVVIAIIGVLVGLLLPAINAARESGRRTQCLNNSRQLALGITGHLNAKGFFPNSVTWATGNDKDGNILTNALGNDMTFDPTTNEGPLHSWIVDILPYIDAQTVYNDFNRSTPWYDTTSYNGTSNYTLASTDLPILTCPNDDTVIQGAGNLSYVCNSGFNRAWWTAWGWDAGAPVTNNVVVWVTDGSGNPTVSSFNFSKKTGLMWPGSSSGKTTKDYKTTIQAVTDGTSTTVLTSENIYAGATNVASAYLQGVPNSPFSSWACAHPNFVAFTASDNVCSGDGTQNCTTVGDLAPGDPDTSDTDPKIVDGFGWRRANIKESLEGIGTGVAAGAVEGSHPFVNSNHPGVFVATFCDGRAAVISNDIDGTVWAKAITPGGSSLPAVVNGQPGYKQQPLDIKDIAQQ